MSVTVQFDWSELWMRAIRHFKLGKRLLICECEIWMFDVFKGNTPTDEP